MKAPPTGPETTTNPELYGQFVRRITKQNHFTATIMIIRNNTNTKDLRIKIKLELVKMMSLRLKRKPIWT